jgi:hypothetical protein
MARRSGKASRQSRQRRAQRSAPRPIAPRTPAPAPEPSQEPAATPGAGGFDAADAAARVAGRSPAGSRSVMRTARSHPADPRFQVAGPSRLSDRAIAEYHYVVRDLRNIGILVVVMAVLLVLATVAVRASGIGQA